jgi:hypothetical protein
MALVAAKCTMCGASIKVDDSQERGVCEHCGTEFITEKVIVNYVTNITNVDKSTNIFIGTTKTLQKYAEELEALEKICEDEKIVILAHKVLDEYPAEPLAYLAAAVAMGKLMLRLAPTQVSPEEVYVGEIAGEDIYLNQAYIVKLFNNAVKLVKTKEDAAIIKKHMSEYNRAYGRFCINSAIGSMKAHLIAYKKLDEMYGGKKFDTPAKIKARKEANDKARARKKELESGAPKDRFFPRSFLGFGWLTICILALVATSVMLFIPATKEILGKFWYLTTIVDIIAALSIMARLGEVWSNNDPIIQEGPETLEELEEYKRNFLKEKKKALGEKYWEMTEFASLDLPMEDYLIKSYAKYAFALECLLADLDADIVKSDKIDGFALWKKYDKMLWNKKEHDKNQSTK